MTGCSSEEEVLQRTKQKEKDQGTGGSPYGSGRQAVLTSDPVKYMYWNHGKATKNPSEEL